MRSKEAARAYGGMHYKRRTNCRMHLDPAHILDLLPAEKARDSRAFSLAPWARPAASNVLGFFKGWRIFRSAAPRKGPRPIDRQLTSQGFWHQ